MKRLYGIVLIVFLLMQNMGFAQKMPSWVKQRPVNKFYYIGIGSAEKDSSEYRQKAKDNALQDLASEIQVNISSEFIQNITEKSGLMEEDVRSQVQSSTKAFLEGYELVDAWEDAQTYWVYYRLSKEEYQKKKAERQAKASALALDTYSRAEAMRTQNKTVSALRLYMQALAQLSGLLTERLEASYNGKTIILQNAIIGALQNTLSAIQLQSSQPKVNARSGQALKQPLLVVATVAESGGNGRPLKNLPVAFVFTKGSGQLTSPVETDERGLASCHVSRVDAGSKLQMIQARIAVTELYPGEMKGLAAQMINHLSLPQTRFILMVRGLSIYLEASESNLGAALNMFVVEPQLKNVLSEKGFTFTDQPDKADIMIELKARTRKNANVYNLYSAFADVNLSITNMNTGAEVFKKGFTGVKGIQLDYEKAGMKALENAAKKLEQLTPEIVKAIQK